MTDEETYIQDTAYRTYKRRIDCGVAREQARKDLPLSTYTEAFWKIDLHNLLHFLKLRCDEHAQLEIRTYAWKIAGIVKELFPITFEAWEDYTFGAVTFSLQERYLLTYIMSGFKIDNEVTIKAAKDMNMSDREIKEFKDKLNPPLIEFGKLDIKEAKNYEDFYPKG